MVENSKSVVDRKENKQRNFVESETKHLVRSHNKKLKMRYFGHVIRTHQSREKDIMLGITGGARKKGSPVCGGWTTSKMQLDSR